MKILELCMSTGLGGLELYFLDTFRHLVQSEIDCYAAVRTKTQLSNRLDSKNDKVNYYYPRSRYLPFITAFGLARFIDRNQIDIIHMHWAKDLALAVLTKFFSRQKPKLVYTRHMAILSQKHDVIMEFNIRYLHSL